MSDNRFDETLRGIREESPDASLEDAAAARVWAKLADHEPIRGCEGFQALIPGHIAGELAPARALLMKDHLHECVACRKAFDTARGALKPRVVDMPRRRAPLPVQVQWAIAAALAVGVGFGSWEVFNRMPAPERARATVESVEGGLLLVSGDAIKPLAAGATIEAGMAVRTPKDARAMLRLADGSLVETRERSELSIAATRRDTTVTLARGSVIVEAAKQRTGHLYVSPRDCRVAVTGTVFSVSSGVKGSRVSVVEGQVRVEHGANGQVLKPGQQYTTSDTMERVSVQDDIAWSRKFTEHLSLMGELASLGKQIEQVRLPAERYSSRLIDLLPRETVFFASVPNLGPTLAEAHNIFRQRMQDSPVLRDWYQKEFERGGGPKLEEIVHQIRAVSDYLGDEVVLAVVREGADKLSTPILFAEVRKQGLVEHVKSQLDRQGIKMDGDLPLTVRENIAVFTPGRRSAGVTADRNSGFAGTPFHAALSKAYSGGAGILFAGDIARLCAGGDTSCGPMRMLGDVRQLLVEQGTSEGNQGLRATLTMGSGTSGLMSLIAEPGPMGALDFFSPDATVLVALALENPVSVLEQFLAGNPEAQQHLDQAQQMLGIDVRRDIAGALGGEVAGGIDGPMLPSPAWKLVLEVYNSALLQSSIEKLVEAGNRAASMAGHPAATLSQTTVNGRTYHSLTHPSGGQLTEVHYTYADGYLVGAGSRALVDAALQNRASRSTIARSTEFIAMVPRDSSLHFSGIVYQNAGRALGPVADLIQGSMNLDENQRKMVTSAAAELKPSMLAFYREGNRLSVATKSGLLGLNNLFGLGSTVGMLEQLGRVKRTPSQAPAVRQ